MKKMHPGGFRGIHIGGPPSGKGTQHTGGTGGGVNHSGHHVGPKGTKMAPHCKIQGHDEHEKNIGTHSAHKATTERGSY